VKEKRDNCSVEKKKGRTLFPPPPPKEHIIF
jgi:hypothetical protein